MANEIIYSWNFEDTKNRGSLWYIIALSIVIGLVIWGFLTKQYGMSFILLLITWIAYFVENNSEDQVNVNITELGITIWETFYEFTKIASYSFIYDHGNSIFLRLNLTKRGLRELNLNVNNDITAELKRILPNFVEESWEWELSFTERMIHLLKL